MAMRFEAVLPGPFNPDAFEEEMANTMVMVGNTILRDFEKTWETWDHRPAPDQTFNVTPNLMEVHIFVDANLPGPPAWPRGIEFSGNRPVPAPINLVYYMLNVGTTVRYATMEPFFKPKTRVRVIGSSAGRGGVASVSVRKPQPGIIAREWDKAIAEKAGKSLAKHLENALLRGARRSGHHFRGAVP